MCWCVCRCENTGLNGENENESENEEENERERESECVKKNLGKKEGGLLSGSRGQIPTRFIIEMNPALARHLRGDLVRVSFHLRKNILTDFLVMDTFPLK